MNFMKMENELVAGWWRASASLNTHIILISSLDGSQDFGGSSAFELYKKIVRRLGGIG